VASPTISNNTLIVQLDGAPYINGIPSGPLDPPEILIRSNSSKIQVQIHKLIGNRFLDLLLQVRGGYISI